MTREIHSIPPAPRRVRWRAVCWQRWPLCLTGLVLAVYGAVFNWMLFLAFGARPAENRDLDAGPVVTATATVTAVLGDAGTIHGEPAELVEYAFRRDIDRTGKCFAPAGKFHTGQTVTIELLPGRPHLNRIVGTRLHLLPWWLHPEPWFAMVVAPGLVVLLVWLALTLRTARLMARGMVAVAEIESVRRCRFPVPAMVAVRYRFLDHHAAVQQGGHQVRARSPLGLRLLVLQRRHRIGRLPVVHDRTSPHRSRLCLADDFLPGTPEPTPRENATP